MNLQRYNYFFNYPKSVVRIYPKSVIRVYGRLVFVSRRLAASLVNVA